MAAGRGPIHLASMFQGMSTPPMHAPEGAAQTFIIGDVLNWSSGQVVIAASLTNPVNIMGVALQKASGVTAADVAFVTPTTDELWEGSIDNDASLGTGAIAAADLGAQYEFRRDANGIWYVDKGATTNKKVTVVAFVGAVGEVMGRVLFRFMAAALYQ
jgi:hypothetical protein